MAKAAREMKRFNKIPDDSLERNNTSLENELIHSFRVPEGVGRDAAWESILRSVKSPSIPVSPRVPNLIFKVVATLILLIGLGSMIWLYGLGNVEVSVSYGQLATHLLPDSSQVTLNAASRLTYNRNRWLLQRRVRLDGEGLFKVMKGSRFTVQTETASTSVLGTVFNVFARKGVTRVSCLEGKVKVVAKESKREVFLTNGMEANTMGFELSKPDAKKEEFKTSSWTRGEFYFNNVPIGQVFDELERQFDVDLFYDGDTTRIYTGYFKKDDLNNALSLVCIPMNMQWSINDSIVIINEIR